GGLGEGVGVHDQHGPGGVTGRREDEQVGQVQAGIAAGVLELGGAEVVGHGGSFEMVFAVVRGQRPRKSVRAALTWPAWVQGRACGPPSITVSCTSPIRPGSRLAVLSSGSTWSASPCRTRMGTSILGRSGRKSGVQVPMQAAAGVAEGVRARFQGACQAWSDTGVPRRVSML